jgi:hypothetical protein
MRPEPSSGLYRASSIRAAEDIVLARLKITEGVPIETLSRFGDGVWDLSPAIFHVPVRPVQGKVDFTGIDCPVERLTAKEYIFAWLNERIADPAGRLQPLQARTALTMLRQFMAFMHGRQGRFAPALIDQPLLDDWLAFQTNRPILPTQVAASLPVAPVGPVPDPWRPVVPALERQGRLRRCRLPRALFGKPHAPHSGAGDRRPPALVAALCR